MKTDNVLFKGFSKRESGTLLLILAAILFFISFKNILLVLSPATNFNSTQIETLTDNMIVSITPDDCYGVSYYDSSYGVYTELKDGSREYSRAYLIVIPNSSSQNSIIAISVESSDKSIQNKLESISVNNIKDMTIKGKLLTSDQDRMVDSYSKLMLTLYEKENKIDANLSQYYIYVDDPTNDIIAFIFSIISLIIGILLLISNGKDNKNKQS